MERPAGTAGAAPEELHEEIEVEVEGADDPRAAAARARNEPQPEQVVLEVAPETRIVYILLDGLAAWEMASPAVALRRTMERVEREGAEKCDHFKRTPTQRQRQHRP